MKHNIRIEYGYYSGEWCYCASCSSFPDLFEFADTWEEALSLMVDAIQTIEQC